MAQNFLACDREEELLLPPSLRDWLPEGHLAWFVIDAVGQLDLPTRTSPDSAHIASTSPNSSPSARSWR
jgi:hypothetical protein